MTPLGRLAAGLASWPSFDCRTVQLARVERDREKEQGGLSDRVQVFSYRKFWECLDGPTSLAFHARVTAPKRFDSLTQRAQMFSWRTAGVAGCSAACGP